MGSTVYMAVGWGPKQGRMAHWVLWPDGAIAWIPAWAPPPAETCSSNIHALAAVSCDLLLHLCLIPHSPGTASDAREARSKEPFWEVWQWCEAGCLPWALFCPLEKLEASGGSYQCGALPTCGRSHAVKVKSPLTSSNVVLLSLYGPRECFCLTCGFWNLHKGLFYG